MTVSDGGVMAANYRPTADDGAFTLTVDGEIFVVEVHPDGGTTYDWTSGPNKNYGMRGGRPRVAGCPDAVVEPLTVGQHVDGISDFLSNINPETGYLGD